MTHDGPRWSNADQDRVEPVDALGHVFWAGTRRTHRGHVRTPEEAGRYVDDIVRKAGTP